MEDSVKYPLPGIKFKVIAGKNDLKSSNQALAEEFHPFKNAPFTPETVTRSSYHTVWWLGRCGHEWFASLNRRANGQGCLVCSDKNKQIIPGVNDFASQNPKLMKEWNWDKNILDPATISSRYTKSLWWIGECSHEWEDTGSHRRQGVGCPYCANHRVLIGYNDFASLNPHLITEWHPKNILLPTEVVSGSNTGVKWICSKGHEWETSPAARSSGLGCAVCSRKRFVSGQNDLESLFPHIAAEWHPTKNGTTMPRDIAPTMGEFWWICRRGHEWKAGVGNRTTHGKGCPRCAVTYSKLEELFGDYLRTQYSGEIRQNMRVLQPHDSISLRNRLELDFWLPELHLAFEIQDFATHSKEEGASGKWFGKSIIKKGPSYHENKRLLAVEKLGVHLIDIWEDELFDGSFKRKLSEALKLANAQSQ